MKQSELIRSISRWRKSWHIRIANNPDVIHAETIRWGPVYWLLLHLKAPEAEGRFRLDNIQLLTEQLYGTPCLAQEFHEFYKNHGEWLDATLRPIQGQAEPQSLLDALYEASIGRDELTHWEPGTFNVERKSRGAFYTPSALALWSVEQGAPAFRGDLRVVDPACGSGVFLAAVVRHFVDRGHLASLNERAEFIEH